MNFKSSVLYNKKIEQANTQTPANPLRLQANLSNLASLSNYNQIIIKPKFDYDSMEILTKVDALSKLIPKNFQIPYSFKLAEVNGERIYAKNGNLACIREYENEIFRDYIPSKEGNAIGQIIEHNRQNGSIINKIERVKKDSTTERISVTIYDDQINDKYTMFQVEDGVVTSITEFCANGKKFRTLTKNTYSNSPQRFMEAKEDENGEFIFTDAKLSSYSEVSEIKRVSSNKEILIKYEGIQKIINVKQKNIEDIN